jgi:hypothetical protein
MTFTNVDYFWDWKKCVIKTTIESYITQVPIIEMALPKTLFEEDKNYGVILHDEFSLYSQYQKQHIIIFYGYCKKMSFIVKLLPDSNLLNLFIRLMTIIVHNKINGINFKCYLSGTNNILFNDIFDYMNIANDISETMNIVHDKLFEICGHQCIEFFSNHENVFPILTTKQLNKFETLYDSYIKYMGSSDENIYLALK